MWRLIVSPSLLTVGSSCRGHLFSVKQQLAKLGTFLSENTVKRRRDEIAEDVESQLFDRLAASLWWMSLQTWKTK